ncbi:Fungal-trans domain-containing protein [Mycena venus]|uniref:Fungal-trans domain-containing protein n=1 Tax=Mycena venus TaxID=2733690 RepID=A0A8H6YGI4_9AGAR|nr:Fungal-trans domain-containing protein [Mycena venus]
MESEEDYKDHATAAENGKSMRSPVFFLANASAAGDSAEMPGNRCTNCISYNIECTHVRLKKVPVSWSTESPKTAQEYVSAILSTSTVYVPPYDSNVSHRILVEVAKYARSLEEKVASLEAQTTVPIPASSNSVGDSPIPLSAEDSEPTGTSESGALVDAYEHLPMRDPLTGGDDILLRDWEKLSIDDASPQIFPDEDLLHALVKIYFEQVNTILAILHFPSFQKSILDGLYLRDREFGALVLAVCALASRHSDDPRVFMEASANSSATYSEHSCGWTWFRQVRPFRTTFSPEPSLYRLQLICLSAIYTNGISIPEESWMLAGLGVRLAQGAGAHHRGRYCNMDPLTAELHRRVFWVLVVSDTLMSSFNGRPSITNPDDFDIDLPVPCDDEYWGTPNAMQPEGRPSNGACLPVYLRLFLIFGRIQRAVYPVNGQRCPEEVIVELDSELNKWVDTVPEHLRWDPHQQKPIFLDQSATLWSMYYHAQILLHRPFIPAPGKEEVSYRTHFASLAICANAARSCGHVLDVHARRGRGRLHYPGLMIALFDSAVVLLVNVWAVFGRRRSPLTTPDYFTRATADAQRCVRILRLYERRWRLAGRECDIINAMLKHAFDAAQSAKRPREEEEGTVSASPIVPDGRVLGSMDGSSSSPIVPAQQRQELAMDHPDPVRDHDMDPLFSLPLLTEELGRMPIYDSFHYEPTFQLEELYDQSHLGPAPGLAYGFDSAPDSIFSAPEQVGMGVASGESIDIELPPISFDMLSGYGWQDWSTYLANVHGPNQGQGTF